VRAAELLPHGRGAQEIGIPHELTRDPCSLRTEVGFRQPCRPCRHARGERMGGGAMLRHQARDLIAVRHAERVAEPRAFARRARGARGGNRLPARAPADVAGASPFASASATTAAGAAREPPPKNVATDVSKPPTGPASTAANRSSGATSSTWPPDCAAVSVI